MEEQEDWFHKWRSPVLYEPDSAFHQSELFKWKLPWKVHRGYNRIDWNIKFAILMEKNYFRRQQRKQQLLFDEEKLKSEPKMRGTGKPYRGPQWSDEYDATEHHLEIAIIPSLWPFPAHLSPTATYDRRWTKKPAARRSPEQKITDRVHDPNSGNKKQRFPFWHERGISLYSPTTDTPGKIDETDYVPFIFFSWSDMPRLSVQERAAMESPEDDLIITHEIERGEWD